LKFWLFVLNNIKDVNKSISVQSEASFNNINVDFRADLHAVLELVLVVAFGTLRLNILLNSIYGRLILNEFLLDIIESIVDLRLHDLIFLRVVLHRVESNLLGQSNLVDLDEFLDLEHSAFFRIEIRLQGIGLGKFVIHVALHVITFLHGILDLIFDSSLKGLYFFKIVLDLFFLNFKSGGSCLSIFHLILLKLEIVFHIFDLALVW